ncbi:uncharacterized protein Dana_GF27687 [Drosophila ananassae]|uniref:Uncharacterized protein n=1 Tax=Drosophila ananassae TaxID=7217 RepID=A0A0P8XY92_DROAN|nr:uncharacterized protein Dana_GF27687 [Drosophila ananassae]
MKGEIRDWRIRRRIPTKCRRRCSITFWLQQPSLTFEQLIVYLQFTAMEFALNLKMFENYNFSHAFKVWMDKRKLDLEEGKVNMSSNLNFIIEGDEPLKKAKRVYRTKYVHQWKEVVHIDGNGTKWVNEKLQCPLCFLACASQRQYSKFSVTPKTHSCPYCPFIKALPNLGQHQKCRCKGRKDTLYKAVGEMAHLRQRWKLQKNEERALEDTAEDDLYEVSEMLDHILGKLEKRAGAGGGSAGAGGRWSATF